MGVIVGAVAVCSGTGLVHQAVPRQILSPRRRHTSAIPAVIAFTVLTTCVRVLASLHILLVALVEKVCFLFNSLSEVPLVAVIAVMADR